jgi:hypothetical protein
MPALSNRERQAARLARYRTMKFALETIRRDSTDPEARQIADAALYGTAPTPRPDPRTEAEKNPA